MAINQETLNSIISGLSNMPKKSEIDTPTNNIDALATETTDGLMSSSDKIVLNTIIESGGLGYEHPTTSGYKHIPAGGSEGQILRWESDGTAKWDNEVLYNLATASSNGLMSSTDKANLDAAVTKLNGIAEGANKYILPTAGSSLGGVKTTSSVTSTDGLTACPIINGVPYYQNTTVDYTLPTASNTTLGGVTTTSTVTSTTGLTACPIIAGVPYYKHITVDTSISSTSTNPVESRAIDSTFSGWGKSIAENYAKKSLYDNNAINVGRKLGTTVGLFSTAEGHHTTATGIASHAEGGYHKYNVTMYDTRVVTIGDTEISIYGPYAYGINSHAEGCQTLAYGFTSHAEGISTTASGNYAHAEGSNTVASGVSHAEGYHTTALSYQHAQGHYNDTSTATAGSSSGTNGTVFVIGNGTSTAASNAFRVTYAGATIAKSAYSTTGADYAEYFEWDDGNPNNEDRRGYFVTMIGDKIKIANSTDYILGIVSGFPSVIGNFDECWMGRYVLDEFGAFINEEFEYEDEEYDEKTGTPIKVTKTGIRWKQNPDYDNTQTYIPRKERPEWSAVGLLGVLSVRDDGTCKVNGYCKVTDNGVATNSDSGYRVIKRVNDNIVKVVYR